MTQRNTNRRIVIIGSGFSGLCLGIQLKKRGIETFTIFEKSDQVGGTWRDNHALLVEDTESGLLQV